MEDINLTKEEIKLIQRSFSRLTEINKKTGEIFYEKLFRTDPEISKLFKADMKEQAGALMRMVKTVVEGLNFPEIIIPGIQQLGRRHFEYGVKSEQYKVFGDCLIMCIQKELGDEFNPKMEAAWHKLYDLLAEVMQGKNYESE